MKFLMKILIFVVVLSFLAPYQVVHADDYVSDAIEALQTSDVYVAPNTENTNYETITKLQFFLEKGGSIVLVMLPKEALDGTDIYTVIQKISLGLDNQKTIGLAVGDQVMGYSSLLPENIASDLMGRADSVTSDPVSALIAFSQNVLSWTRENISKIPTPTLTPEPTPTLRPTMTPIVLPKVQDVNWSVWVFLLMCLLIAVILFVRDVVKNKLRRKIEKIQRNVNKIRDTRIREDLTDACQIAFGLLEILQQSGQSGGYTGVKFPVLLANMDMQVLAFVRHESRKRRLPESLLKQLKEVLLNYDSLFLKLQENDPEAVDLLTSVIDSNTTMISSLGYLSED